MRFFSPNRELATRDAARLLDVDHRERVGLLAFYGSRVVGTAAYDRVDRSEAEISFTVADTFQGRGLGSVLLQQLAAIARENGIHRFRAEVLASNKRMLATFEAAGYAPSQTIEDAIVALDFDIDPTKRSRGVSRSREHRAESLSIRNIVAPAGVAVLCENIDPGSEGDLLVRNLVASGFVGDMAVVHADGSAHGSVAGYRSIVDVSAPIDVALISLPAHRIADAIDMCSSADVSGLVIVSGGFAERGDYDAQRQMVRRARRQGMRIIGPSALGLINTDPGVSLNASLVTNPPRRGRLGVFCQAGAFGAAILEEAHRRGLGISTFASVGDHGDVSSNDMLQYWRDDDATSVVVLHVESIGNPRKFARLARRLALKKPVVVVRSGAATHLVPLSPAVRPTDLPPAAFEAILDQAGLIQVDNLTQLMEMAGLLSFQPLPRGPHIGVLSDSDAFGTQAVDVGEALGLEPVGPPRRIDPADDVLTHVSLITEVLNDPGVDALVICHAAPPLGSDHVLREALDQCAGDATKPIVAVILTGGPEPISAVSGPHGLPGHGSVPVFSDLESAMGALSRIVRYVQWVGEPRGEVPVFSDVEPQRAHHLIAQRLGVDFDRDSRLDLADDDLTQLLDCYGIEWSPPIIVDSEESAVETATIVGYPVVMKTRLSSLAHRADLGGIRLSLENERAVRSAYLSMAATLTPAALAELVIQRMAPPGVATVVGTAEDPLFGPVIRFRLAGEIPQLLSDYGYWIPPVTDRGAAHLVRAPKASPILVRESDPAGSGTGEPNIGALEDLLMRLGRLADDLPELGWLELNPVIVHAAGISVLNAQAWVARPVARTDLEARRLRG